VTGFAEIAASSLLIRSYVPERLQERYDRIVECALMHAVMPEVEEAQEWRPLAEVISFPVNGHSKGVA
jgi:hypothetical protein